MRIEGIQPTLEELQAWTKEYEKSAMVYADSNRKCYDATIGLFLRNVPGPFQRFATQGSGSFLEPWVRETMAVPEPPAWVEELVATSWSVRAFCIRNLHLPRFNTLEPTYVAANGRLKRRVSYSNPGMWKKHGGHGRGELLDFRDLIPAPGL
jgi:hypothetical protein